MSRSDRRFSLALVVSLLIAPSAFGQMVTCVVEVNYEAVSSTHKDLLHNLQADVSNYVNNYNWGEGNPDEKVSCMINIFVKSAVAENRYLAQIFVGSARPIYNVQENTAVIRVMDELWEFGYVRDRPLEHNFYTFDGLTSLLDFYMLLVMGYDFDTYDRLGGTPYFQTASEIASKGRSLGVDGWQVTTSSYSRVRLVDELLSPAGEGLRAASWEYHFNGLDSLSIDREAGYRNMLAAVESIGKLRKKMDPLNLVIRSFFETKYMELATLFDSYPDRSVYHTLSRVDPAHTKTYEEFRTGSR
jgi:hypothetical protein